MLLGVTVLRKKYPVSKYLCVLLIVTGVALFMYKPKRGEGIVDDHLFGYGELLLVSANFFTVCVYHFLNTVLDVVQCT